MTAKYVMTQEDLETLIKEGESGKAFADACKTLGYSHVAVRGALRRQGLIWEAKRVFPSMQANPESGIPGYRVITLDDYRQSPARVPDNPQARCLAMSWRAA